MMEHRRAYQDSNDKLRRARRLYKAFISKFVLDNPEMCIFFAVRAIANEFNYEWRD